MCVCMCMCVRACVRVSLCVCVCVSASYKLDVNGSARVNGNLHLDSVGNYITFYGNENADHSISSRDINGATADDLRINSYGSVFVNLDSNSNNTDAAFVIGEHGDNASTITERFRVQDDGNVGIGTSSPASKLHVNGDVIRVVSSTYAGVEGHNTNGTWESYIGTESGGSGNRYNSASSTHTFYKPARVSFAARCAC